MSDLSLMGKMLLKLDMLITKVQVKARDGEAITTYDTLLTKAYLEDFLMPICGQVMKSLMRGEEEVKKP